MLIFVDGDNLPGRNTAGADRLDKDDIIMVYYAENNGYYNKEENRKNLKENTYATVMFMKVAAGSNAVDLSVAMALAPILGWNIRERIYVLISNDRHFKYIKERANKVQGDNLVVCEPTINDAVDKYKFLEYRNPQKIIEALEKQFGKKITDNFIKNLKKAWNTYNTFVKERIDEK